MQSHLIAHLTLYPLYPYGTLYHGDTYMCPERYSAVLGHLGCQIIILLFFPTAQRHAARAHKLLSKKLIFLLKLTITLPWRFHNPKYHLFLHFFPLQANLAHILFCHAFSICAVALDIYRQTLHSRSCLRLCALNPTTCPLEAYTLQNSILILCKLRILSSHTCL